MYLYPQEYKRLNKRLRQHQKKFRETLDKSQDILKQTLDRDPTLSDQAAEVRVYGRTKEIYSLWHKMETKGEENLDHIVDVVALRVIITPKGDGTTTSPTTNNNNNRRQNYHPPTATPILPAHPEPGQSDRGVWLCYHVLGLVQHLPGFQPVPTRVKDYISFPKPNGYQSLHTALMLNGQTIEVQIRTNLMHQVAEYGMASHWAYTDGKRQQQQQQQQSQGNSHGNDDCHDSDECTSQMEEELYNTPWLSSIKEWQDDIISSRDFVDSVRRELLGKRVFVFLRNGKILNLARGATAIDAAFAIHTEVGLAMHAVEINGKPVRVCVCVDR
jgi:(p)ppGpp synthase/HD superfamily hydrolase